MNTDTPNTTILRENSGTTTASPKPAIALPDLSAKADTETIGILEAGLYGMLTEKFEMVHEAYMELAGMIDQEKEKEKKEKEEKKVKEEKKEKEKEDKEKKKDDNVASTTTATSPPTETQILAPQVAHQASPENLRVTKNSTPLAIVHGGITISDKFMRAPWARTPREAPQRPQRRSMHVMESGQKHAQDKLVVASSAQEEEGPVVDALVGQVAQKTKAKVEMGKEKEKGATIKVESPILKPIAGTGVTKKAVVKGLRDRIAQKVKSKAEMGKEKGVAIKVESPILKPMAGTRVVKEAVVRGLRDRNAQKAKAKGGVDNGKSITAVIATDRVTRLPRSGTLSPEVLCAPQRRSMRIIGLMQKSAQEEGVSAAAVQVKKEKVVGVGLRGQVAAKAAIDGKSAILRPRAGAGITKKTVARDMKSRIVAGAKRSIEMAKEVENQSITPATTTDKVIDAPRARTSPEVLHNAQRRSMRVIELMQKSALKERESAEGALVEGKKIAEAGSRRLIAAAVLIDVKPQMKPRAGAGVSKSGKPRGGKKPSVLEKK